mmetsp:Transcript_46033/g.112405  ORF Transcript_46033/g.112405 Transcript_46033/m.112405 type:complete len:659 (+) Transcript_46033:559-2535(+)
MHTVALARSLACPCPTLRDLINYESLLLQLSQHLFLSHTSIIIVNMSTLEYLDGQGSVKNFGLVPWETLHGWLWAINGSPNVVSDRPGGINRGRIIEELEARRIKAHETPLLDGALRFLHSDRGIGKDWREFESSNDGLTHLEELLVYQPSEWRKQAREYFFRYDCNLSRESTNEEKRTILTVINHQKHQLFMKTPILAILFHPEMNRTDRYQPLNFLLAYGVCDPLPALFQDFSEEDQVALMEDLSPLDYFLDFQNLVSGYRLDKLRKIGKEGGHVRVCLIKELDFCDIIGQRLAKQMIRQAVVSHVWNRSNMHDGMCLNRHPLSMIFAGQSGNGKTELAIQLAKLMNKPGEDFFVKVDCGKLTNASEVFGLSGAYQGARHGSALNNFVLKMSMEPQAIGIVLLDEIEKASQDVIHALYQVIDKGEWTNKRLSDRGSQTDIIPCHNIIFIMTTNACDFEIKNFVRQHDEIYSAVGEDLEEMTADLGGRLRGTLQFTYPFTEAFLGRISRIVPFLPMANRDVQIFGKMVGESLTVAKLLIERQQEKFHSSAIAEVKQFISPKIKHQMASIIVKEAIEEGGVRSIQMAVERKMGDRLMNSLLLEKGGIEEGSHVRYFTKEEIQAIDFRVEDLDEVSLCDGEAKPDGYVDVEDSDDDLYS